MDLRLALRDLPQYVQKVSQESVVPGTYLYRQPKDYEIKFTTPTDQTLAIVTKICKKQNLTVIKLAWTNPEDEGLYFKCTDRDLHTLGTQGPSQEETLSLELEVRFSLLRNVLNGRYFTEGYFFCQVPEDCARVFCNLNRRLFRLDFYKFTAQIISWKPILQEVSNSKLSKDYEKQLYHANINFELPDLGHSSYSLGVLFQQNIVFKFQCRKSVPTEHIIQFNKSKHLKETNKLYRYSLRENKQIAEPMQVDKKRDNEFKAIVDQFTANGKSYYSRIKVNHRNFLKKEKPGYTEEFWNMEEEYLKGTFEGRLLLGYKPYDSHQHIPHRAVRANDYVEIPRNNRIYKLPLEAYAEKYPKEMENPDTVKNNAEKYKKAHVSEQLYKIQLPISSYPKGVQEKKLKAKRKNLEDTVDKIQQAYNKSYPKEKGKQLQEGKIQELHKNRPSLSNTESSTSNTGSTSNTENSDDTDENSNTEGSSDTKGSDSKDTESTAVNLKDGKKDIVPTTTNGKRQKLKINTNIDRVKNKGRGINAESNFDFNTNFPEPNTANQLQIQEIQDQQLQKQNTANQEPQPQSTLASNEDSLDRDLDYLRETYRTDEQDIQNIEIDVPAKQGIGNNGMGKQIRKKDYDKTEEQDQTAHEITQLREEISSMRGQIINLQQSNTRQEAMLTKLLKARVIFE